MVGLSFSLVGTKLFGEGKEEWEDILKESIRCKWCPYGKASSRILSRAGQG
jgi:hypothetical protein